MVDAGVPPNRRRRRPLLDGPHVPMDEEIPLGCHSFDLQDLAAKKIRDVFDVAPQARAQSKSNKSSSDHGLWPSRFSIIEVKTRDFR
jgi:hypothetical protein